MSNVLRLMRPSPILLLVPIALGPSARAGGPADEAVYEMVFVADWSAETHPIDFPSGAHFSTLIGGTHDSSVSFWDLGELASDAIERMAETGASTDVRNEVLAAVAEGSAGGVIQGGGISSPGQRTLTFTASRNFPRATIVSMIAPSPDWFIGVSGISLFEDGHWLPELVVELAPIDAGTDSGTSYSSPNEDTQPPEPIHLITGYPFAEDGAPVVPLGSFAFRRVDAPPCPADVDASGDVTVTDLIEVLAQWGPCSGCAADLDDSGAVDVRDLLLVLSSWGPCG